MRNYYVSGDWNALCDRCGFKFKASMLRKEWTGLRVCSCCYETRHPQDLLKVEPEQISVPWTRPEPAEVFTSVPEGIEIEGTTTPIEFIYPENSLDLPLTTEG